jgi:predicted nucleotidyltransferase
MDFSALIVKYKLVLLVGFGSWGTERFTTQSDIDLAYQSREPLSDEEQLALLNELMFLFKRDGIDLVDLNRAVPLLLYEVACRGRVLYEEPEGFLRFKLRAGARYAETKFLRDMRAKYLNEALRSNNEEKS